MVLNNSQHNAIMRMYDARSAKNRHELDEKTARVYAAAPSYKKVQDMISSASVEAAKASIRGDRTRLDYLHATIAEYENQLRRILTDAGFPSDYLNPVFDCPLCKDTGYVGNEKCSCFRQAEIDFLYDQSGIDSASYSVSFDQFRLDYYPKEMTDPVTGMTAYEAADKALSVCRDFVQDFPGGKNLLLYGPTGVGKTFLSNCMAKEILNSRHSVLYTSAINLFQNFSDELKNNDSDSDFTSQVTECDLLIIDDLGTELSNAFTNSKLFYCINTRMLNRRSTIISTNCSLKDLMEIYTERIFDRISSSYTLVKLIGNDIRFIKK